MLAIPAIDVKDGKVVRLLQGRYEESIVYSHNPLDIAKLWQKEGAERIHFIDLEGARTGEVKSITVLREIVENVKVPIQFGGGLRSREDIASVLSIGAKWAIIGTIFEVNEILGYQIYIVIQSGYFFPIAPAGPVIF